MKLCDWTEQNIRKEDLAGGCAGFTRKTKVYTVTQEQVSRDRPMMAELLKNVWRLNISPRVTISIP